MSAKRIPFGLPICEACWIKENAVWEPHSMDDKGNMILRLKGIEVPVKMNTGETENCSACDKITIAGIYQFVEPEFGFDSYAEMDEED
jgi:hypothetical protein